MPLIDLSKWKRYYHATVTCANCNHHQEMKIPRGRNAKEFLNCGDAICENCGCSVQVVTKDKKEKV